MPLAILCSNKDPVENSVIRPAITGAEPALDYIRSQIKVHRAKIGRALQYLEDVGHLARRPQVDYLGDQIYELRVAIEQHQHRLLYFFHECSIIIITI